jgi:RsiW-degrading membrane proteinase PrsW (M82 family)
MRKRTPLPWLASLILVAVASTAAALGAIWWSSELQVQVYAFYRDNPQVTDSNVYAFWDHVSTNAYTLQSLATPLFLAALVAVLALLVVLEVRSHR